MHDVTPRDTLDRAGFIFAFLLGVGGGLLLKIFDAHPLVSAIYAAVILVFYALVAWAGGRIKLEPETVGDNCYYLGFLFTLASLSFTLYQMGDPAQNNESTAEIPDLISGFGVALSSTIFGVFLRVLMMQLRSDFVARDREVRADINRAFGEFRKNMSAILVQMKAYSTESVQLAAERDQRIRTSTEKFVEDYHESLKANADLFATQIEEAFSGAAQQVVRDISAAMAESQKAHQERMDEALREMQQLKERLQRLEAEAHEDIQAHRKRMAAEVEESVNLLKTHKEEMKAGSRAMRSAADAIEKRLIPALDALGNKTGVMEPELVMPDEGTVADGPKPQATGQNEETE